VQVFYYVKRGICHVEFNAARVLSQDPLYLLHPDALGPLIERLMQELHSVTWPTFFTVDEDGVVVMAPDWQSRVKFKRIDLARDIHISDPGPMRKTLAAVTSRYQRHKAINTSTGDGWTLYNRSKKSGLERLYDKTAQIRTKNPEMLTRYRVPENTYRFETALRDHRIVDAGLTTLDRVSSQSVWEAMTRRWIQTRWDSPITLGGGLRSIIRVLSDRTGLQVLGFLASDAAGGLVALTDRRRRELLKECRELGLTPGLPLEAQGGAAMHVDLWEGGLRAVEEMPV
jgi:hypothetical protein